MTQDAERPASDRTPSARLSHTVDATKHSADDAATSPTYRDDMSNATTGQHVVVVGAGMVAHRFVESLLSRAGAEWRVTVVGDEGRHPYDRGTSLERTRMP